MTENLESIAAQIKKCTQCRLCENRTNAVPGVGNPKSNILFVGEGPGKDEDLQGEPFVGQAGKILNQLLESINLTRADVFITNVVKCRPPDNRDPLPDEVETCWQYLEKQTSIINPDLIVTLGRHSMNRFLPGLKISEVHGQAKRYKGKIYFPMYHPAVALYSPSQKETLLYDIKKIPILLKKIRQLKQNSQSLTA